MAAEAKNNGLLSSLPGGAGSCPELSQQTTGTDGEPAQSNTLSVGSNLDVPVKLNSADVPVKLNSEESAVVRSMPLWPQNHKLRQVAMELCYAAADNDITELQRMLLSKVDPNLRDFEHRTALHVAAGHGRVEAVRALLNGKADPNPTDTLGRTPLSLCDKGGGDVEQVLREFGAHVQLERVRKQAKQELWAIKREDVDLKDILGETLKSRVHKATWKNVDVVAKFCLDNSEMKLDELEEEMLHEITILARLRHPDLVMFLGACLQEEPIMFLTEFMPGGDLEHYFKTRRNAKGGELWRPSAAQSKTWSSAVLRALAFLHNLDTPLIHRDLKPLNLLLSKELAVKVTDFGISKMIRPQRAGQKKPTSGSYHMTGGVGSWKYMAPEVTRHQPYTTKVDIYSFGLILFFITAGKTPFHEFPDPIKVLDLYVAGQEPRPRSQEAYRPFRALMEVAWAADPQARPTAQGCLDMLQSVDAGSAAGCGPCANM